MTVRADGAPGIASGISTLGRALLAAIARAPVTGYGLTQLLRDPIGFFWETRHSQIYPELSRLQRAGLIESATEPGPGPRPKRTYAITEAGRAAVRDWIAGPTRFGGRHDELLLKVYASWLVEPAVTAELIRSARAHHAAQHQLYAERDASARERGIDRLGPSHPDYADYLTLRRGLDFERGRLAWCDWVLRELGRRWSELGRGQAKRAVRRQDQATTAASAGVYGRPRSRKALASRA